MTMKPPRRTKRTLSGEDIHLWGEIAKLVTPLRGRAVAARTPPASPPEAVPKPLPTPLPTAAKVLLPLPPSLSRTRIVKLGDLAPPAPAPVKAAPTLQRAPTAPGLERKERRALQRGTLAIEARIDLHGLYQAEAHAALVGFIARARAQGHTRVLVVTGKGGDVGATFSARGVLRRSVPHWLRGPDLRSLVLGFEEAGRQHGGSGALYVRLRRR